MFITLIIIFFVHLAFKIEFVEGMCTNAVNGGTWKFKPGRDVALFGIETVEECSVMCASNSTCKGYTWRYDGVIGWCYKFAVLEDIFESAGVHSGTVTEVLEGSCLAEADAIIDEITTQSSDECAQLCYNTNGCVGYTWYEKSTPFPQYCFLYSICEDVIPCYGCSSGRISCVTSPQCYQYNVLDEESRSVHLHSDLDSNFYYCDRLEPGDVTSPRWQGQGYYRIMEPAGTVLSSSDPGINHCGTYGSGWIRGDTDDIQVGEERTVEACFTGHGDSCFRRKMISVTRCPGDYFVYQLSEVPTCFSRYCAALK